MPASNALPMEQARIVPRLTRVLFASSVVILRGSVFRAVLGLLAPRLARALFASSVAVTNNVFQVVAGLLAPRLARALFASSVATLKNSVLPAEAELLAPWRLKLNQQSALPVATVIKNVFTAVAELPVILLMGILIASP